jgi:colanic acid biosynthesis glycosyl transferase WcaI
MRITILTQYFPPEIGGPQTRLAALAAELKVLGHDVEVVTGIPNYPRGEFFAAYRSRLYQRECAEGIVVHRVWLYPSMGGGFKRLVNYLSFAVTSVLGLLAANRADYIFVESPPLFLSIPAAVIAFLRRSKVIFSVADLWPDAIVQGGFMSKGLAFSCLEALERWSYRRATYVNAVTEGIRDALLNEKQVPADKVLYLPNGVDTTRFLPRPEDGALRTQLALEGKKVILWAGTLGYAHGIENILHAAKLLGGQPEIHFVFVGDGSAKTQIRELSEALQLSNVTFLDPVSNRRLAPYLSIATAGLASLLDIPLHRGARPSKIFPVLASGKPLIFIGRGEAEKLVRDAGAGIVVAPGNPDELAAAITRIAGDPELAEGLGACGRKYVEEHLQWSKLIESWVQHLEVPRTAQPIASKVLSA